MYKRQLNTIPFIYGIEHEGNLRAELLLSPPSLCAKNFAEHNADIALVPAAAVPSLADAQVVTEYCIGAAGPVRTVVLLSNEPIEKAVSYTHLFALLTSMPLVRLISHGESDELTLFSDEAVTVTVTAQSGTTTTAESYRTATGGLHVFRLDTRDFPEAETLTVDAGACGSVAYTVISAPTGARRLAWRSSAGGIEHYTLSLIHIYLLAKHWKVTPEYYTLEDYAQLGHALPGDAFLLIGDKVFDHEGRFAYSYEMCIRDSLVLVSSSVWNLRLKRCCSASSSADCRIGCRATSAKVIAEP